ncbi:MAG: ParB/RepB/Spo0J family partition protein [Acidimicrobiia bacterium]|nr:ParB/RepB/Spo0J family partition protein [Acidimicrobiia bacterium]
MARQGGLGRGLGALIPPGAAEHRAPSGTGYREIPVTTIRPNPYQPRDAFDEQALGALADSIREVGLLQPVLVRPAGDGFELIAGERRWRAAQRAGLQTIPALVRETDDNTALEQALVENLQRDDLNPLEEAGAYQQLIEDFHLTHEQVASRMGKSRAAISNTLRLLQLPPSIQRTLREGQLTMGHARALLGTPDRAFQEAMAKRIVKEDLSVRQVEEAVRARNDGAESKSAAPVEVPGRMRPAGLAELEELLGDHLDTRVRIRLGAGGKGTMTIDFAGLDDLERVYRAITQAEVIAQATTA